MAKLGEMFPPELQAQLPAGVAPGAQVLKEKVRVFVSDLAAGQELEGVYLVSEASLRVGKNGAKYIQGSLTDRTGSIPIRQWDVTDQDFACWRVQGYIKVRGRVERYKNSLQMIVFAAQECGGESIVAADFLPVSTRAIDEMEQELLATIGTIADPDFKRLLEAVFADESTRERFKRCPAASSMHHAWIGGLIEHVLSACKTAQVIAEQRPYLNRDLLLTGVILHDIGKIDEISANPGFGYTDTGRLCGHITLGALLVERVIARLENFPQNKRDLIIHMILSHHGEREYGSPVTPLFGEAVALHHLECLDAKVQGIQSIIERETALGNDSAWTEFARVVDGRIYKNAKG